MRLGGAGQDRASAALGVSRVALRLSLAACVPVGLSLAALTWALGGGWSHLGLAAAALAASLAGIAAVAQWLLAPLQRLALAARRAGEASLAPPAPGVLLPEAAPKRRETNELVILSDALGSMIKGLDERRTLRTAIDRYVPPPIVESLLAGRLEAQAGGHRREVSILLADLRGFTAMSGRHPPEETLAVLNRFLSAMVGAVEAHQGTVDKFIGDAVLAVFGWPLPCGTHALAALSASLTMNARLAALNAELHAEGRGPLGMGIAATLGSVVAGNIGSEGRLQCTVIGEPVNLAARIEPLNKQLGTRILASEALVRAADGRFETRDMGTFALRGIAEPQRLYEVIRRTPPASVRRG